MMWKLLSAIELERPSAVKTPDQHSFRTTAGDSLVALYRTRIQTYATLSDESHAKYLAGNMASVLKSPHLSVNSGSNVFQASSLMNVFRLAEEEQRNELFNVNK